MPIGHFIKEIGRGKDGAKALSRVDAADLFGQVLDQSVSDLEVGAFCLAMRIKGETTEEMCGFLDASQQRLNKIQISPTNKALPAIVIPTYNGARKLPVLTPLLAMLLAQQGFPVVLHGTATEDRRVSTADVLSALGVGAKTISDVVAPGEAAYFSTASLHGGLQRLLDVRRVVHLRNPAHSLVKLLLPCSGPQLLVTSYTHPEYAISMEEVLAKLQATALLLRGTEGEAVADARRLPKMVCIANGRAMGVHEHQPGSLHTLPGLPTNCDAQSTATYIEAVLKGKAPVPTPIAIQVDRIVSLAQGVAD